MVFFSKKTVVCERCGKEYEVRISLGANICPECQAKQRKAEMAVQGYVDYARKMNLPDYTTEQLEQIVVHRQQIMEKYRMTQGISKAELMSASDNYKKLSDEQAFDVLIRMSRSTINTTIGAAYSGQFYCLSGFDQVVVDAQDVFAVGFKTTYGVQCEGEAILCVVFTNDPYVPVFPVIYTGKLDFFEIWKSKKGREGVAQLFYDTCPNLTYQVQDLKQLKKQMKEGGAIKGNIDQKKVMEFISSAMSDSGIFNAKNLSTYMTFESEKLLNTYGYIEDTEINRILKMDKMFNRNYWNKQIKKLSTIR